MEITHVTDWNVLRCFSRIKCIQGDYKKLQNKQSFGALMQPYSSRVLSPRNDFNKGDTLKKNKKTVENETRTKFEWN